MSRQRLLRSERRHAVPAGQQLRRLWPLTVTVVVVFLDPEQESDRKMLSRLRPKPGYDKLGIQGPVA